MEEFYDFEKETKLIMGKLLFLYEGLVSFTWVKHSPIPWIENRLVCLLIFSVFNNVNLKNQIRFSEITLGCLKQFFTIINGEIQWKLEFSMMTNMKDVGWFVFLRHSWANACENRANNGQKTETVLYESAQQRRHYCREYARPKLQRALFPFDEERCCRCFSFSRRPLLAFCTAKETRKLNDKYDDIFLTHCLASWLMYSSTMLATMGVGRLFSSQYIVRFMNNFLFHLLGLRNNWNSTVLQDDQVKTTSWRKY